MKYLGKGGTFVRIRENKKHFILFYMLGFFIGIVYANLMSKDYITSMGIFNEFFLSQYMQADVDVAEYIWYVVRIRVAPVAVICALGCTRLRKLVVVLFLLWTGFSSGMIMPSSVLKMESVQDGQFPALYCRRDSAGVLCESGNYADVLEDVMRE